jgi:hypothetical protein
MMGWDIPVIDSIPASSQPASRRFSTLEARRPWKGEALAPADLDAPRRRRVHQPDPGRAEPLGIVAVALGGLHKEQWRSDLPPSNFLLQVGVQWDPKLLAGLLLDDLDPPFLEVSLAHVNHVGLALPGVASEPNGAAEIFDSLRDRVF